MIDKAFLEQQLQRLQQQHDQSFRASEQILGAIQYVNGLLKKVDEDEAAAKPPQQE